MAAILVAVSVYAGGRPHPAGFHLIAHPSVQVRTLRRAHVAEIFLKTQIKWSDGTRIRPVDQPIRSAVRARFLAAVYDKEPRLILRYWQRKIFSGRGYPPLELPSDERVLDYVRRTSGAIGYVEELPANLPSDAIRVLEVVP